MHAGDSDVVEELSILKKGQCSLGPSPRKPIMCMGTVNLRHWYSESFSRTRKQVLKPVRWMETLDFIVGCQENREKPGITMPCLALCGLH